MSHVYVLVEHDRGQLSEVTAELITAARPLGVVSAVVVGPEGTVNDLATELAALGAEQIIDATADDYDKRLITPEVDALHGLGAANPAPIVIAGTNTGNEIAGRLGARLASGVLANVVRINADRSAEHLLFGGTVDATAVVGGNCPIYTVRPGSVKAEPAPASGTIAPMPLPAATAKDVTVTNFTPAEAGDRPALASAKAVVAGGRGVGSEEGFHEVIEPLADSLNAAVGATRDAVDEGWYDASAQIGQTGETISPELYIGAGISGAIQHLSGMQTAGTIVVINSDGDEPFFQIADLGVVGDLHEIVPALTNEINSRK
ncbi:electron transfer flavoprotein subunit alpha [Corynebacterium yudongzhengii]|uniref:Electron transfer flavoprotein subunit alpha/FixB family protein n=1 Tax=Corynebacterium yudongzhengii TaxID=2080740 RepID=A0A2U1T993_9CORY|nr:electron transfer flavoprotein subunit alpha/FixB family protein [Corynebacterium yudongzhengii]AWB82086.1 electron transfer flavoprotein subunit alpha [Corynebacterium yudongzhengii]PWC02590.1 electron transfer flavoprotein subunit alpha/FixB family protein [Corynebacterium yudongzhengii]